MSSVPMQYLHFLTAKEEYPRVVYFRRRFTDLLRRFLNIQAALPTKLRDKNVSELEKLDIALGRGITICVYGHRDIPDTYLGITESSQSSEDEKATDKERITVVVITADVENIDLNAETTLEFLKDQCSRLPSTVKIWPSCESRIVKCRVSEHMWSSLTDKQVSQFRNNVHVKLNLVPGNTISLENIIVEQTETNIKQNISDLLEDTIIELGFCAIKRFLNSFIRTGQIVGTGFVKLIDDPDVLGAVRLYFRSPFSISDTHSNSQNKDSFIGSLLTCLAKNVKCALVPVLAKIFNIHSKICNDLLEEANFEENLKKALQKNTVYQFEKIYENAVRDFENCDGQQKCYWYDYIVYMLQKDWKEEFERIEKIFGSMNRLIAVMKKMIFEIDGYLKQSKKYKYMCLEGGSHDLTDELRKKLLSIEGVYGVGNIYGQLEVHSDSEKEFSTVKQSVDDLLNKFNYHHPYSVKLVKENQKS